MKRFSLAAALACALVSGVSVQAGNVSLPTSLSNLTPAGAYTTNGGLTFSEFDYSTSGGPAASAIRVLPFHAGIETGLSFHGAFVASAASPIDSSIDYTVTAAPGSLITDATSIGVGSTGPNGGYWDVSEVIIDNDKGSAFYGQVIGSLDVNNQDVAGGSLQAYTPLLVGAHSILIQKDIAVGDGSASATVSIIDQGFSTTAVPEPASMALFGIGLTGILAFRRRLKKASV